MTRITAGLVLFLSTIAAAPAAAQDGWLQAPDIGFFALGVSNVATSNLDAELTAHGYPTFGRRAIRPAIGAYWDLPGGIIFGGEWHGIILDSNPHEGVEVGMGGGYATLGLGYALELSARSRIYPRLGFGVGGLGLWIEEEEGGGPAVSFDEALENPAPRTSRDWVLSRTHAALDLGIGAEFMFGGRRGFLIGARAGYLAAPFSTDWQLPLDDAMVTGGPAAAVAGPYLQVLIGGGRRR